MNQNQLVSIDDDSLDQVAGGLRLGLGVKLKVDLCGLGDLVGGVVGGVAGAVECVGGKVLETAGCVAGKVEKIVGAVVC